MSRSSMQKEDLGTKPYKKCKFHGLSEDGKVKRLVRSSDLLERHGYVKFENWVFSDENLFSLEESFNIQNIRMYALRVEDKPEDMRTVERVQNENNVMVWAAVSKKR